MGDPYTRAVMPNFGEILELACYCLIQVYLGRPPLPSPGRTRNKKT